MPRIHISLSIEVLSMLDEMAAKAALPGEKADRSRMVATCVAKSYRVWPMATIGHPMATTLPSAVVALRDESMPSGHDRPPDGQWLEDADVDAEYESTIAEMVEARKQAVDVAAFDAVVLEQCGAVACDAVRAAFGDLAAAA